LTVLEFSFQQNHLGTSEGNIEYKTVEFSTQENFST